MSRERVGASSPTPYGRGPSMESDMNKLLVLPLIAMSGGAFAAVPEAVSDAIEAAATDAGTVAGLALLVVVAIYGFRAMRRGIGG